MPDKRSEEQAQEVAKIKEIIDSLISHIDASDLLESDNDSLRLLTTHIENSLKHRPDILKTVKEGTGRSGDAKNRFLATMSHEIRTPMNGVIGMLELLLNTRLSDRQQHLANTAYESAASLLNSVNDILDFTKIASGKLNLIEESLDLRQTLEDCLDLVASRAQDKNIELIADIPDHIDYEVIADSARFRQVITNILDNAIKFTEHGSVKLFAKIKHVGDMTDVSISVSDTGKGMSEAEQQTLFQPFTQGDSTTAPTQYTGIGLGLSITRDLVIMMGGEISLHSSPGNGSTFILDIQLKTGNKINTCIDTQQLRDTNVLIVNMHESNCDVMTRQFTNWGMLSNSAKDSEQALTCLRKASEEGKPYKIIIYNQDNAESDYPELLKNIRNEPDIHTPLTLILTPIKYDSDRNMHEDTGTIQYLHRPARQHKLLGCLLNLTKIRTLQYNKTYKEIDHDIAEPKIHAARILLVEDNVMNQEVMYEQLTTLGYDIDTAENGLQAIEAVRSSRYDLIFMDGHMPAMDGFTAARAIRDLEHQHNKNATTIIALTTDSTTGIEEHYKTFGMNDCLVKPFTINDIENILNRWFDRSESVSEKAGKDGQKNEPGGHSNIISLHSIEDNSALHALTDNDSAFPDESIRSYPVVGNNQYLLIVDDNHATLEGLHAAMVQLGYLVDSTSNCEKALQLVDVNNYDLVITDLQMPGMNGYALCEAIRKRHSQESLPILVLTSTEDDIQVQDAYKIGVSNFIVKPVNFLNLAYTVLFTIQNVRNTHALWHNRQLLEAAEQTAQVSHWSWDIQKQHLQFSNHLQEYFNKPLGDIATLEDFINIVDSRDMDAAIQNCLTDGEQTSWEQEVCDPECAKPRFILHRFRMVLNEDEKPVLIGTVQEISSIRNAEHRIMELAFYDSLTKLDSRSSFNKKLRDLIITSKRQQEKFALLYLDLDDFKNINDSYGHDVGDQLLIEVADRLRTLLREDDFASRLGGDEFCLLINNITENLSAANVAQRCLEVLTKPVTLTDIEIAPHASIGIAIYPNDGDDNNHLVKAADTAMYEAKQTGKNNYAFYESAMTDAAQHRLMIESELRTAIAEKQFELYYQPIISLTTGNVHSVEALVRWIHPVKGIQSPATFIPDIERMGLIDELGLWVMNEACEQLKSWSDQGLDKLSVAVNISPRHFEQPGFSGDIAMIAQEAGISPSRIEIEITESISRDHTIFLRTCQELRAHGFKTAIDDFGTGYSSLSVLKDAAVDILKIDREFVRHLPNDLQSSILFGTILGMSKALNLKVVAEGIETEDQLKVLVSMGCHMAQGYYFSKPVPATEVPALSKCSFRRPRSDKTAFL